MYRPPPLPCKMHTVSIRRTSQGGTPFVSQVAGNYYPVNSMISLDDGKTEMAVVTDVSMVRHTTMRRAPSSQSDFSLSLFLLSYFLKYPLRVPDSDTFSYPL